MYVYLRIDGTPISLPSAVKVAPNGEALSFVDEDGSVVVELRSADVWFYSSVDVYAKAAEAEEDSAVIL